VIEGSQESQSLETVVPEGTISGAQWMAEEAKHQQRLIATERERGKKN
jgi:hypothetical protein